MYAFLLIKTFISCTKSQFHIFRGVVIFFYKVETLLVNCLILLLLTLTVINYGIFATIHQQS